MRKFDNYYKIFNNTFIAFYILSILFFTYILYLFLTPDHSSDIRMPQIYFYLIFTTMSTLLLIMCLITGINLDLKVAKAKKLIIHYSTCTDWEELSNEFKFDYYNFCSEEFEKPLYLTMFFRRNSPKLLIIITILISLLGVVVLIVSTVDFKIVSHLIS